MDWIFLEKKLIKWMFNNFIIKIYLIFTLTNLYNFYFDIS